MKGGGFKAISGLLLPVVIFVGCGQSQTEGSVINPAREAESSVQTTLPRVPQTPCEDAIAKITQTIPVPPAWKFECTYQLREITTGGVDNHVYGSTILDDMSNYRTSSGTMTIYKQPLAEYEKTVTHEIGHAWDIYEVQTDSAAIEKRKQWALNNGLEWNSEIAEAWFTNEGYSEQYVDEWTTNHGYP